MCRVHIRKRQLTTALTLWPRPIGKQDGDGSDAAQEAHGQHLLPDCTPTLGARDPGCSSHRCTGSDPQLTTSSAVNQAQGSA